MDKNRDFYKSKSKGQSRDKETTRRKERSRSPERMRRSNKKSDDQKRGYKHTSISRIPDNPRNDKRKRTHRGKRGKKRGKRDGVTDKSKAGTEVMNISFANDLFQELLKATGVVTQSSTQPDPGRRSRDRDSRARQRSRSSDSRISNGGSSSSRNRSPKRRRQHSPSVERRRSSSHASPGVRGEGGRQGRQVETKKRKLSGDSKDWDSGERRKQTRGSEGRRVKRGGSGSRSSNSSRSPSMNSRSRSSSPRFSHPRSRRGRSGSPVGRNRRSASRSRSGERPSKPVQRKPSYSSISSSNEDDSDVQIIEPKLTEEQFTRDMFHRLRSELAPDKDPREREGCIAQHISEMAKKSPTLFKTFMAKHADSLAEMLAAPDTAEDDSKDIEMFKNVTSPSLSKVSSQKSGEMKPPFPSITASLEEKERLYEQWRSTLFNTNKPGPTPVRPPLPPGPPQGQRISTFTGQERVPTTTKDHIPSNLVEIRPSFVSSPTCLISVSSDQMKTSSQSSMLPSTEHVTPSMIRQLYRKNPPKSAQDEKTVTARSAESKPSPSGQPDKQGAGGHGAAAAQKKSTSENKGPVSSAKPVNPPSLAHEDKSSTSVVAERLLERRKKLASLEKKLDMLKKIESDRSHKPSSYKDKMPIIVENRSRQATIQRWMSDIRSGKDVAVDVGITRTDTEVHRMLQECRTKKVKDDMAYSASGGYCLQCFLVFNNLTDYFAHLSTKKHCQNMGPISSFPWQTQALKKYVNVIRAPGIIGEEFVIATNSFYCYLCSELCADDKVAEAHIKSAEHFIKCKDFLTQHPAYKTRTKFERRKCSTPTSADIDSPPTTRKMQSNERESPRSVDKVDEGEKTQDDKEREKKSDEKEKKKIDDKISTGREKGTAEKDRSTKDEDRSTSDKSKSTTDKDRSTANKDKTTTAKAKSTTDRDKSTANKDSGTKDKDRSTANRQESRDKRTENRESGRDSRNLRAGSRDTDRRNRRSNSRNNTRRNHRSISRDNNRQNRRSNSRDDRRNRRSNSRDDRRNRRSISRDNNRQNRRSNSRDDRRNRRSISRDNNRQNRRSNSRDDMRNRRSNSRDDRRNRRSISRDNNRQNRRSNSRDDRRNRRSNSRDGRRNRRSNSRDDRRNRRSNSRDDRRNRRSNSRDDRRNRRSISRDNKRNRRSNSRDTDKQNRRSISRDKDRQNRRADSRESDRQNSRNRRADSRGNSRERMTTEREPRERKEPPQRGNTEKLPGKGNKLAAGDMKKNNDGRKGGKDAKPAEKKTFEKEETLSWRDEINRQMALMFASMGQEANQEASPVSKQTADSQNHPESERHTEEHPEESAMDTEEQATAGEGESRASEDVVDTSLTPDYRSPSPGYGQEDSDADTAARRSPSPDFGQEDTDADTAARGDREAEGYKAGEDMDVKPSTHTQQENTDSVPIWDTVADLDKQDAPLEFLDFGHPGDSKAALDKQDAALDFAQPGDCMDGEKESTPCGESVEESMDDNELSTKSGVTGEESGTLSHSSEPDQQECVQEVSEDASEIQLTSSDKNSDAQESCQANIESVEDKQHPLAEEDAPEASVPTEEEAEVNLDSVNDTDDSVLLSMDENLDQSLEETCQTQDVQASEEQDTDELNDGDQQTEDVNGEENDEEHMSHPDDAEEAECLDEKTDDMLAPSPVLQDSEEDVADCPVEDDNEVLLSEPNNSSSHLPLEQASSPQQIGSAIDADESNAVSPDEMLQSTEGSAEDANHQENESSISEAAPVLPTETCTQEPEEGSVQDLEDAEHVSVIPGGPEPLEDPSQSAEVDTVSACESTHQDLDLVPDQQTDCDAGLEPAEPSSPVKKKGPQTVRRARGKRRAPVQVPTEDTVAKQPRIQGRGRGRGQRSVRARATRQAVEDVSDKGDGDILHSEADLVPLVTRLDAGDMEGTLLSFTGDTQGTPLLSTIDAEGDTASQDPETDTAISEAASPSPDTTAPKKRQTRQSRPAAGASRRGRQRGRAAGKKSTNQQPSDGGQAAEDMSEEIGLEGSSQDETEEI